MAGHLGRQKHGSKTDIVAADHRSDRTEFADESREMTPLYRESADSLEYSLHFKSEFSDGSLTFSGRIELACGICGYKNVEPFEISIPVSIISINGKLYFIPKNFCIFEQIPVEAVGDYRAEPEVEYITLRSGLYVPESYVSGRAMKELTDLDEEFAGLDAEFERNCGTKCTDWKTFETLKKKIDAVVLKQAKILIRELEAGGFTFDVRASKTPDGYTVTVTSPNGEFGLYRSDAVVVDGFAYECFMGKWSFLGPAYKEFYARRGIRPSESDAPPEEAADTCKRAKKTGSGYFDCSGIKVFPLLKEGALDGAKAYILKYVKLNDGIGLALNVAHIHTGEVKETVLKYFGQDRYVTLFTDTMRCRLCGKNLTKHEIYTEPIEPIVLNGWLGITHAESINEIGIVEAKSKADGKFAVQIDNLKPSAFYVILPSGLYVPLEYVGLETLRKLLEIDITEGEHAIRLQADLLVKELEKKGFGFEIRDKDEVKVIGPDMAEGAAIGRFFAKGKWGPVGYAYLVVRGLA